MRVAVAAVVIPVVSLTTAQHAVNSDAWWLELSRYLPYPALLLPSIAVLVLAFWLGRWWVLVCAANLALALTLSMGFEWNSGEGGPRRVRLMTYNIKADNAAQRRDGMFELGLEVARHDPDILVMQDANGLLVARGDAAYTQGPVFGLPHVYALGQYIVASRFTLRDCVAGQIGFRDKNHRYLRCVVDAHGVALNVVTAHFQSPRAGLLAARNAGLAGAHEWRRNYEDRLEQAHALAHDLAGIARPLVVAGDLNAPEPSPVIQTLLATGLRDAFSSAGRGYGYTYGQAFRRGYSFLRIDHILVSPDVGLLDSFVGRGEASHHKPVIADLLLH